jgi:hypothetical protein
MKKRREPISTLGELAGAVFSAIVLILFIQAAVEALVS